VLLVDEAGAKGTLRLAHALSQLYDRIVAELPYYRRPARSGFARAALNGMLDFAPDMRWENGSG
jgi:hypothetical protein